MWDTSTHKNTRAYDAVGNQTSVTIDGVQFTGTYNPVNELPAFGNTIYTYDKNGNRLTATIGGVTTTYGYVARNELISLSWPVTASYTYNGAALGRRLTGCWPAAGRVRRRAARRGGCAWDGAPALRLLIDAQGRRDCSLSYHDRCPFVALPGIEHWRSVYFWRRAFSQKDATR